MFRKIVHILILVLLLLILFGCVLFIFNIQNNYIKLKNKINVLLLEKNTDKKNEKYESLLKEYVLNQNQLKNMWWHTVINQSGLSIIFAVIVLIITLSVSYITNHQFQKTVDNLTKKFNKRLKNSFYDFKIVMFNHHEPGGFGKYENNEQLKIIKTINSYNKLKEFKRDDFKEYYDEDINKLKQKFIKKLFMKGDCLESIKILFYQLENKEDRKRLTIDLKHFIHNEYSYEKDSPFDDNEKKEFIDIFIDRLKELEKII